MSGIAILVHFHFIVSCQSPSILITEKNRYSTLWKSYLTDTQKSILH